MCLRVSKTSQKQDKVEEIVLTKQSFGGYCIYSEGYSEKPLGVGVRTSRRATRPKAMGWLPTSIYPKRLIVLLPLDFQGSARL